MEIWKSVENYEGILEVSNFGNVRTLTRIVKTNVVNQSGYCCTVEKTIKGKLCSLRQKKGYLQIAVRTPGKRHWLLVHRLVAKAFLSEIKDKPKINHKDGNKENNHVDNLEWCTDSENQVHALKMGLCKNEEKHYKAKLTKEKVNEIRNSKDSSTVEALKYGVHKSTIKSIRKYKTWKYVNE